MPEIIDLRGRLKSVTPLGEFSTITFTMVGLGEPRQVRAASSTAPVFGRRAPARKRPGRSARALLPAGRAARVDVVQALRAE